MDAKKEILDAIDILIDRKMQSVARIYTCVVINVNVYDQVSVVVNGESWANIKYYGTKPTVGDVLPIFVPNNNMSLAFIISPGK